MASWQSYYDLWFFFEKTHVLQNHIQKWKKTKLNWSLIAYAVLESYRNSNNSDKNTDDVKKICWISAKEPEQ